MSLTVRGPWFVTKWLAAVPISLIGMCVAPIHWMQTSIHLHEIRVWQHITVHSILYISLWTNEVISYAEKRNSSQITIGKGLIANMTSNSSQQVHQRKQCSKLATCQYDSTMDWVSNKQRVCGRNCLSYTRNGVSPVDVEGWLHQPM